MSGNNWSQSSRANGSSELLSSSLIALLPPARGMYSFLSFWFTLCPPKQLLHHNLMAASALNSDKGGPSMLISKRSCSVLVWRFVLHLILTTLNKENICSTRHVVNGKLNTSSHNRRMFGHLTELGQIWIFACSFLWLMADTSLHNVQPLLSHPGLKLNSSL